MKKITAFFMAFLPIFVVILLFATGMLIKNVTIIPVTAVEMAEKSIQIRKEDDVVKQQYDLDAYVLPMNASNPDIYWTSSDENVATVDKEGIVTAVGYGEAKIYATSADNQTISSTCTVEVWDDKIHSIAAENEFVASYIGVNQEVNLNAYPVPRNRIKGNPALKYTSSNNSVATVGPDGLVIGKSRGESIITISCVDPQFKNIEKNVKVYVGTGVSSIAFETQSRIEIKSNKYDLFNDLVISPAQQPAETQFTNPENFDFTSSNDAIATVDKNGIITFNQADEATFTATYKRNKKIKAQRIIKSNGNIFKDVSFNRYTFADDLSKYESDHYLDPAKVYAAVYPEDEDLQDGMRVTSTNIKVVEPEYDSVSKTYKYKVNGAGTTTLVASIYAKDGSLMKEDRCVITITNKANPTFISKSVNLNNSAYYWLRSNVDLNTLDNEHQEINWQYDQTSEIYDVDLENEIVHFKKPGTATFSDGNGNSFVLNCGYEAINTLSVDKPTYTLEVGKRYQFNDGSNTWIPTFSLEGKFDIDDNHRFIPRSGCYDKNVTITNGSTTKKINVIVKEDVLDIKYDHNYLPNLVTAEFLFINVPELIKPKIIPSTATNISGETYKPSYDYRFDDPDAVIIDSSNNITFLYASTVYITVKAESVFKHFSLKSTHGAPSKFLVYDEYNNPIQSGQHISLNVNQSKVLYINNADFVKSLSALEIYEGLSMTHLNEGIIESTMNHDSTSVWTTITAKASGNDTFTIKSSGFNFVIYVDVTPEITDFDLAVNWKILTSISKDTIVTYTNNFITDVVLNSPLVADLPYTYNLNDTGAVEVENNRIDFSTLTLNEGQNKLVLTANNYEETFYIEKRNLSNLSFSLENQLTDKLKNDHVYLPAGFVSTTLTVIPDGIVDDTIYSEFVLDFDDKDIIVKRTDNKFLIEGIAQPTDDNPGYDCNFNVTFNKTTTKAYQLHRETISKILFPGLDNTDKNDQKGLQQVHVFGNETFSSPEEKKVNYCKVPIEIYDYKNELIKDEEKKKQAWERLTYVTDDNTTVDYGIKDAYNPTGYLKVHFDNKKFYTQKEMYDDAFASSSKHNINLTVCTPSNFVSRSYEFVPVDGINAYHQDAFANQIDAVIVLQTNFGLEDSSDSVPFDNPEYSHYGTLYGNGYSINFNNIAKGCMLERGNIDFNCTFNTNIILSNEENKTKTKIAFAVWLEQQFTNYFAYNTLRNGYMGLHICETKNTTYVKNSLFYDNQLSSVNINGKFETSICYVQDCIFFNSSSSALTCTLGSKLYCKGFIDVYNFKSKNILSNIAGYDLSFLWDEFKEEVYAAGVMHTNLPDGMDYLNSVLCCALEGGLYFWNDSTGQYDLAGETGTQWTLPYWKRYLSFTIASLGVKMWATFNNEIAPDAPSYFDQYDENGLIRWDFMSQQIKKLVRIKSDSIIYPY